ncbi:hypothetical protein [Streptomyces sp. 900116325]
MTWAPARPRWVRVRDPVFSLLGSPAAAAAAAAAVGDALHEMTPVLEALDRRVRPVPITALTAKDLPDLIGRITMKP